MKLRRDNFMKLTKVKTLHSQIGKKKGKKGGAKCS